MICCEILYINGVKTHEIGCNSAWHDYSRKCKWCGNEFKPEEKWQEFCDESCSEAFN